MYAAWFAKIYPMLVYFYAFIMFCIAADIFQLIDKSNG